MSRPKVSVIMIAYNQEATIDEAIRSVVRQRAPFPFELIVADDASTDSTAARAQEWQRRYPAIVRVVAREKNLGLQANYLDAWSRARGEYIAICEGDDHWCSPHKLRRQAAWLDSHPECALTFHRVVNHYADTRTMSLSNPGQPGEMTLEDLARGNTITNLSVMYRALPHSELPGWLSEIKLFDYAIHSLHAARGTIHYMRRPMAVYRRYSRGIWSGDEMRAWLLALDVRERLMNHFHDSRPEAVKGYLAAYVNIAAAVIDTARSRGDNATADDTVRRLRQATARFGSGEITDSGIRQAIDARRAILASRTTLRGRLLHTATILRATLSRLLPVPRIR